MVKRVASFEPRVKHGVFLIQKNGVPITWLHHFLIQFSVQIIIQSFHPIHRTGKRFSLRFRLSAAVFDCTHQT